MPFTRKAAPFGGWGAYNKQNMKKLFTFIVAATATISTMAQHSAAMTFVGKANFYVTMGGQKMGETNMPSDTIIYSGADFIIPSMNYNGSVIPSFTIKGTTFSGGMNGVTWADQPFETTVTVDGTEKTIKGSSLTGTYTRANNIHKVVLSITFTYGNMPMPLTYNIESYYVKSYTDALDVEVKSIATYPADEKVTYNVRTYEEDGKVKLDVAVPSYTLKNTLMGDLNVGTYTVKGLEYNEEKGGYYRNYANDGLTMQFSSSGSIASGEYALSAGDNSTNIQDILVTLNDKNAVTSILNQFKVGKMPFQIVSTFPGTLVPTAIADMKADNSNASAIYNINGQVVKAMKKGNLYIVNGKKYFCK